MKLNCINNGRWAETLADGGKGAFLSCVWGGWCIRTGPWYL